MKLDRGVGNLELAELLRDIAAAYQIKDAKKNKFKIIAYENAAAAVEHLSSEAKDLWDEGRLEEVSGIGPSISEHLGEIFKTGKSKHFEEVLSGLPKAIFELMKVQDIGPKTAYKLVKEFNISDANPKEELKKLAEAGKIRDLEGFGEQSEKEILTSLSQFKDKSDRILLSYAEGKSREIIEWLKKNPHVKRIDVLGSLRRKVATIGDIDLSVVTANPEDVLEHFVSYPNVSRVLEKGVNKASILVPTNIQIDIRVQPEDSYGSLLQHFTGSKHHNIALREFSLKKGLSLSEYGIKDVKKGIEKKFGDEASFYKYLGLDYISPELREDSGEIEAAREGKLPKLIELKDIKGDLQIHSDFNIETSHDLGNSSMETIVKRANELGYEYIAFTEHNPSQKGHTDSQIVNILQRKREKVDKLNYSIKEDKPDSIKKVFNSLEIDILPSGKLPVADTGMETLDFALVSLHSSFRIPKKEMTKRVVNALAHPKVKIFAHPTARNLLKREGVELDWEEIFEFCKKHGKWLEINADPARLDLPDFLVKEAIDKGLKLTLGTDSHHVSGLDNMLYGIYNARRGWAKASDIINTRSLNEFEDLLRG